MPPFGNRFPFVFQHHQGMDQSRPGLFGKDDMIGVPQLSGLERAGEVVPVLLNQSLFGGDRIIRLGQFLSEGAAKNNRSESPALSR